MQIRLTEVRTYDEAVSVGDELVTVGSTSSWALGDLANHVATIEHADPELEGQARTLKTFAHDIRVGYSRLKDAARVSRAVEPGVRESFPRVHYAHFRELVRRRVAGSDLVEWARRADDESWSSERLAAEVIDAQRAGRAASSPDWQGARQWLHSSAARGVRLDDDAIALACSESPDEIEADVTALRETAQRWEAARDGLADGRMRRLEDDAGAVAAHVGYRKGT